MYLDKHDFHFEEVYLKLKVHVLYALFKKSDNW